MNYEALVSITLASVIFLVSSVFAQSNPALVQFTGLLPSVKGAFYMPDASQPVPHVGILVMHRTANYMGTLHLHRTVEEGICRSVHEPQIG